MHNIKVATFVLDDERTLITMIEELFKLNGVEGYTVFTNSRDMLDHLHEGVHICIVDYLLGETINGLDVMKSILNVNPDCKVIVMSAQTDAEVVVQFLNNGAFKYINKNQKGWLDLLVTVLLETILIVKKRIKFQNMLQEKYHEIQADRKKNLIQNDK